MPDDSRLEANGVPLVHGIARLATLLFAGQGAGAALDLIGPEPADARALPGWLMDQSWLHALNFAPFQAAQLQARALALSRVFRLRGPAEGLRLLALCAPGDLMVNAPLDFITAPAGLRLDLAFVDGAIPDCPPHDAAFVAVSESAPDALRCIGDAYREWPTPVLNDPDRVLPMSRDWLPLALEGTPGVRVAPCWRAGRDVAGPYPLLLRPLGSHGGQGLAKLDEPVALAGYLAQSDADAFYACPFIDYRSADGWYRKYRIAFVEGAPFICHMAASEHWMVHYLNAGMDGSQAKRDAERDAMATFETGFAQRHGPALAGVAAAIGLDYFSIDCAEFNGELLVFEADVAAIIHSMDDPAHYPYKRAAMQLCYDAFGSMVRRRVG